MIAPGSVGTTTARKLIGPLMATGPGSIGMIGPVDRVIQIPVAPDHRADLSGPPDLVTTTVVTDHVLTDHVVINPVSSVVRVIAQNLTALPMGTALGSVGTTTAQNSTGQPIMTVPAVVPGIMIAQNLIGLLMAIVLGSTAMIVLTDQPVPDLVAINQLVHPVSTGKTVRTSVTGIPIRPVLRTTAAAALIGSVVTVRNGKTLRMVVAPA
ncbi:hypothetical protein GCM10028816_24520 [Spirosoma lituiforme]